MKGWFAVLVCALHLGCGEKEQKVSDSGITLEFIEVLRAYEEEQEKLCLAEQREQRAQDGLDSRIGMTESSKVRNTHDLESALKEQEMARDEIVDLRKDLQRFEGAVFLDHVMRVDERVKHLNELRVFDREYYATISRGDEGGRELMKRLRDEEPRDRVALIVEKRAHYDELERLAAVAE